VAIVVVLIVLVIFAANYFVDDSVSVDAGECDYSSGKYIGRNSDECSRVQVLCIDGFERFDNECGCGCDPVSTFCSDEDRGVDACIEIYQPVCGYDSNDRIVKTFSNTCFACLEENVAYWADGECQEQ